MCPRYESYPFLELDLTFYENTKWNKLSFHFLFFIALEISLQIKIDSFIKFSNVEFHRNPL